MKKEFNLSDWIVEKDLLGQDKKIGYIHSEAVKEFIIELKKTINERIDFLDEFTGLAEAMLQKSELINITNNINKLAGNKLI